MNFLRVIALVGSCVSLVTFAQAQPKSPAEAAKQFEAERIAKAEAWKMKGDAALDAGRPVDALLAYEEAWKLHRLPSLLYNRARAYEKLAQFPEALAQLERFAIEADASLKAKVPKLGELLTTYRSKTTRLVLDVEPMGAEVRLGDRILGTAPLAQLTVNAGPATTLLVTAECCFPSSQTLALPDGGDVHVKVALGSKATESVLRVESETVGAVATIDPGLSTELRGSVPLESLVKPGAHVVRLASEGFLPAETAVVVRVGELKLVRTTLSAEPRFYERWYFWVAIGAVVVAGATVGIVWSIERPLPRGTLNTSEPPLTPSFLPRWSF